MTPTAGSGIRFGHVNLTSTDWRGLAALYIDVLGCVLVPPVLDLRSAALDALFAPIPWYSPVTPMAAR